MLEPAGKELAEQGYLVGLLSVFDAILDIKLDIIAKEFSLGSRTFKCTFKF